MMCQCRIIHKIYLLSWRSPLHFLKKKFDCKVKDLDSTEDGKASEESHCTTNDTQLSHQCQLWMWHITEYIFDFVSSLWHLSPPDRRLRCQSRCGQFANPGLSLQLKYSIVFYFNCPSSFSELKWKKVAQNCNGQFFTLNISWQSSLGWLQLVSFWYWKPGAHLQRSVLLGKKNTHWSSSLALQCDCSGDWVPTGPCISRIPWSWWATFPCQLAPILLSRSWGK